MVDEESEIVQSHSTARDIMVISGDTENALVPATAVTTEGDNITHSGPIRFDGDTRVVSEENAKISAQHKNPNLALENPNLTPVQKTLGSSTSSSAIAEKPRCRVRYRLR